MAYPSLYLRLCAYTAALSSFDLELFFPFSRECSTNVRSGLYYISLFVFTLAPIVFALTFSAIFSFVRWIRYIQGKTILQEICKQDFRDQKELAEFLTKQHQECVEVIDHEDHEQTYEIWAEIKYATVLSARRAVPLGMHLKEGHSLKLVSLQRSGKILHTEAAVDVKEDEIEKLRMAFNDPIDLEKVKADKKEVLDDDHHHVTIDVKTSNGIVIDQRVLELDDIHLRYHAKQIRTNFDTQIFTLLFVSYLIFTDVSTKVLEIFGTQYIQVHDFYPGDFTVADRGPIPSACQDETFRGDMEGWFPETEKCQKATFMCVLHSDYSTRCDDERYR